MSSKMFKSRDDQNRLKRLLESEPPRDKIKRPKTADERSRELSAKCKERLLLARFRQINEFLYTNNSKDSNEWLSREKFTEYHKTFELIVKKWPKNPINAIIDILKKKVNKKSIIGDIGCGKEPQIKRAFPNLQVHSFDLISTCEDIIKADMTRLPLKDQTLDFIVYSLSLMATNLKDCLSEANRVLKLNSTLIIAEVVSRFDSNEKLFISQMTSFGFQLIKTQNVTQFFVLFEFKKTKEISKNKNLPEIQLKSCFYKLR